MRNTGNVVLAVYLYGFIARAGTAIPLILNMNHMLMRDERTVLSQISVID